MKQIAAAFVFFTRLPVARRTGIPMRYYQHVVAYWPLVGWVTGAVTAGVLYAASLALPAAVAVLLAVASRVLLTGALHEDGLSDFLDGFGGGSTPERTLAIMKDSRTGSYGVVGLILYFMLLVSVLASLPVPVACAAVLAGDPLSKFVASRVVNRLPYARTPEHSKSGAVHEPMRTAEFLFAAFCGLLPLFVVLRPLYWLPALAPMLCFEWLVRRMKKRIAGYTGDCCGALFLLSELSFYLVLLILCAYYGVDLRSSYLG